jgi:hypothetical protein
MQTREEKSWPLASDVTFRQYSQCYGTTTRMHVMSHLEYLMNVQDEFLHPELRSVSDEPATGSQIDTSRNARHSSQPLTSDPTAAAQVP